MSPEQDPTNSHDAAPFDYVAGLQQYIEDNENDVLRPHQIDVFKNIQEFFADTRSNRGYVQLPTGTGKTVIFVELSKAILESKNDDGDRPKILIVTPTIDLVHQTLGRSGKKGYGKFAPDLTVSAFFSDSTSKDRRMVQDSDVVVTTYKSMALMDRVQQYDLRNDEEIAQAIAEGLQDVVDRFGPNLNIPSNVQGKASLQSQLKHAEALIFGDKIRQRPTGKRLLDLFDVYKLDEGHHALGDKVHKLVDSLEPSKVVIGFTATPDANQKKKLESVLPRKIHNLAFNEAIEMGLLSPLVPIGVKSGASLINRDIFDAEGEYLDERISHLASSASRNRLVVDIAKVLANEKVGTIVSCLAGDEALHSRVLAEQMRREGVRAEAVYGAVNSLERQRIYERFEAGEIDVLTFVEVLGEGWDSNRAKAIINARPTRSLIIAQQRLGRVVRPGNVAFSFDIMDTYDKFNPPLYSGDLLDGEDVPQGKVFGELDEAQDTLQKNIYQQLGKFANIVDELPADYSNFHAHLGEYTPIVSGNLASVKGGHYSIPSNIIRGMSGLNDEILDKVWEDSGQHPDVQEGVMGYTIRRAYERKESERLLIAVPENDPIKALTERDGTQWMSNEGLRAYFGNRYPDITERIMDRILTESKELLKWRPLTHYVKTVGRSSRKPTVYKAYQVNAESVELLDKQIRDYFDILKAINEGKST